MAEKKTPITLSIGGGKGGVGKSMVSANLAVQYAKSGMRVILLDLDFGAANVHTLFGIRQPPKGLGDYFTTPRSKLEDYLVNTSHPNLRLAAGNGFVPELANLQHMRKVKLIKHIKQLDADLVLLDLGAGSANNVVDFFSMTHASVVVTSPEPTAVINAYEFLKNVVYRILFRMFRNQKEITSILKISTAPNNSLGITSIAELAKAVEEKDAWAAENIRTVCAKLDSYIILNQATSTAQANVGRKLRTICQNFLSLDLNYAGLIFHNQEVSTSVHRMIPLSLSDPECATSKVLKRIATQIFRQMVTRIKTGTHAHDFEEQVSQIVTHARKDYEDNLLVQKRIQRQKQPVGVSGVSEDGGLSGI
jgi:flagellar biosynthesis protein FlhG